VNKPTASVIICCYTEERLKDIHEAVESVLAQTLKPHEVIIAVDHNKQLYEGFAETYQDSVEIRKNSVNLNRSPNRRSPVSDPQPPVPIVLVLNEGARGFSATKNVAIRAAKGDIVAFLDDDAIAEKDWLLYLTKLFKDESVVAVGGRTIPLWLNGRRPSWFPEELDWIVGCTYKGLPLNGNEIRNVPGGNTAFRKGVFEKVGFFRSETGRIGTTAGCGEEADLCLRITHAMPEALIAYQEKAIIHHKVAPHRTTWRYLWKRSYNEGFYKSLVKRLSSDSSQTALSTEDSYLRYLLFKSIPERLAQFYRGESLPQTAAIIVCIAATGVGYLVGKARA